MEALSTVAQHAPPNPGCQKAGVGRRGERDAAFTDAAGGCELTLLELAALVLDKGIDEGVGTSTIGNSSGGNSSGGNSSGNSSGGAHVALVEFEL